MRSVNWTFRMKIREYQMYEDTAGILAEYGYQQYEISNYAKDGYACRHNIGYWKRTEYLGLGLGASSLYGENRFSNTRDMQEYLGFSGNTERIRKDVLKLSLKDQIEEFMYLGLRMTEGISEIRILNRISDRSLRIFMVLSCKNIKRPDFWRRLVRTGDLQEKEFM